MLLGGSTLGFHTSRTEISNFKARVIEVDEYEPDLDYENTIAYYSKIEASEMILDFLEQDIHPYFALRVLRTHPKQTWYPTISELKEYGVIK